MHAYARGCTFIGRHLKETVLKCKITWSAMGKQNLQLKRSVVRRLISSNGGCNSNPAFFFFCSKVFSWIIFQALLEYLIIKLQTKRINLNWLFTLSCLNSNFAIALGFLHPGLNNPA